MKRSVPVYFLALTSIVTACSEKNESYMKVEAFDGGGKLITEMAKDSATMLSQKLLYADGKINYEGEFSTNKRHGKWESFFPDGTKWSENNYHEGEYHGPYFVWYQNGQLRIKGQYDMGKKIGIWEMYDQNGTVLSVEEPEVTKK